MPETPIADAVMASAHAKFRTRMKVDGVDDARPFKDRYLDETLDGREIAITLLGHFHYQVENGGLVQWWDNGYAAAKGPNGRTAPEALVAVMDMHRGLDPDVADLFSEMAAHVARVPEHRSSLDFNDGDEDDDFGHQDEDNQSMHFFDARELDRKFGELGDRRYAFIEAVAAAHVPEQDPFKAAMEIERPDDRGYSHRRERERDHFNDAVLFSDGNAYAIISKMRIALRRSGVPADDVDAYTEEAKAGDYDNVVATTLAWSSAQGRPAARPTA